METKTNRGGAPKKAESEKRERRVEVLFTNEEFNRLKVRKETTKVADLSGFIRAVCLEKPLHLKPQLSTHEEKLLSILREMRSDVLRISVNINQSSKRINSTTDYRDLQKEVNSMVANMSKFDQDLQALSGLLLNQVENKVSDGSADQ